MTRLYRFPYASMSALIWLSTHVSANAFDVSTLAKSVQSIDDGFETRFFLEFATLLVGS